MISYLAWQLIDVMSDLVRNSVAGFSGTHSTPLDTTLVYLPNTRYGYADAPSC
jgi:hypothetical protein